MLSPDKRHAKELWNSELRYMALIQNGLGSKSEAIQQTTQLLFPCAFIAKDFVCPKNILFAPNFNSFFIIFRCVCLFFYFSASWSYIKILLIEDFFGGMENLKFWHFQGVRVLPGLHLYKVVAIIVKRGRKESIYHLFGGFILFSCYCFGDALNTAT